MNIFKTFSNCLQNKSWSLNEGFSSFMFCRYLSMSRETIKYAEALNIHSNMDDETQYEFIKGLKKPHYIRWIQIPKNEPTEFEKELSEKYNISLKKAKEYADCIN